MPKNFSIKISDFTGIFRAMADKANENGDEILDYRETSIFNVIKKSYNSKNNTFVFNNTIFDEKGNECNFGFSEKNDATYVAKNKPLEDIKSEQLNQSALDKANSVPASEKNYKIAVKNYRRKIYEEKIKSEPIYNDIKKVISHKIGAENAEKRIMEIAPMVIELCKKYEIYDLAPMITYIFGTESGGFVFTKEKMDPDIEYKGVMQVDFLTCQCIFSEGAPKNKDWHEAHFKQDDARIEELRKRYGNAQNLYDAIKTDVKLGLEVGIIAYKAKLHEKRGDVRAALGKYCGDHYKYPFDNIPKKFDVSKPKQ